MKILSFNINGLRAHLHQLDAIMTIMQPDIIGLQETKVHDNQFPIKTISHYGYHVYCYGQKSHYGVALLSRIQPLSVRRGFINEGDDSAHCRVIIAEFIVPHGLLTIVNGYAPQGGERNHPIKFPAKKYFYYDLQNYIEKNYHHDSLLLIMGDMNISPTDLDVGIGEKNRNYWIQTGKCSFLPEEREWIDRLLEWGLVDIYRQINPTVTDCYSWFDYRSYSFNKNRGLRIDLMLASQPMFTCIQTVGIAYSIRAMIKPSDHVPIWAIFNL